MASTIDVRLAELGISLPTPAAPVACYLPFVRAGSLVMISGQITMDNGELRFVGKLGETLSVEEGYQAARLCGVNLIAQMRAACSGDLNRVKRVVRLGGFVNCTPNFTDHPKVINGASDLMQEVFGDAGQHARVAVGSSSLPLGIAVEVDAVIEVA